MCLAKARVVKHALKALRLYKRRAGRAAASIVVAMVQDSKRLLGERGVSILKKTCIFFSVRCGMLL